MHARWTAPLPPQISTCCALVIKRKTVLGWRAGEKWAPGAQTQGKSSEQTSPEDAKSLH